MSVLALPFLGAPVSADTTNPACSQSGAKVDSFLQRASATEDWRNGNIIEGLVEGGVVLEKVELSRLDPGTHELVIDYAYQRDGIYAFDKLQAASFVPGPGTMADGANAPSNNPNEVVHRATFTWTQPAGNDAQTITFAAHLASEAEYGAGLGAGSIAGSPFHLTITSLDCVADGSKTNQVKVDKPTPPPAGSITAKKVDDKTGAAIDTAKFQLWDDTDNNGVLDKAIDTKNGAEKTTSNGTVTWTDLAYGKYLVEETAAPDDYTLPTPAYLAVTVDAADHSVCLTFRDTKKPVPPTGSITAKKVDKATSMPIDTATFQLWKDVNGDTKLDSGDTKVSSTETTGNGSVTWTDLAYGDYLVQETAAPDGYTLPDPAYQATTVDAANHSVCLTFRDVKAPGKATVTVKKLWRINGQSMWEGDQPSGFTAQLTLTGPGTAGATNQDWGKLRGGYAIGDEVTIDESATVPQQCTLDRSLFWENGKWVVKPLPYTATLAQADNFYKVKNDVTCKTSLTVSKVDDASGNTIDTATFQLWNDVNANKTLDPADTKVGTTKSTSNGTVTWTDLAYGNYLVEETAAPADYTLPSPSYQPVTVDKNHLWPTLTFRDAKKSVPPSGSITVHKHAGTTDGPLLDTAKFQLWKDVNGNAALDQADAKVGTEKSTSNGVATWTDLPYGKYLVQETVAPAGYTLPSPSYQAVTVNGTATLEFVDQPKVTPQIDLQVHKHAGKTDGPLLDTARFQLWNDVNGNKSLDPADTRAGAEKSTSNGITTWSDLAPGAYMVEETVAPTGYTRPDPAYRAVTLTAAQDGTTVVLDFADQLAPVPAQTVNLQVLKHAGSTAGRLIDTATFQLWNDVNGNGVLNPTVDTKVGSTVATSGGAYTWTGLATGTYLVQEVTAPEGYKLASPRYQAVTLAAADLGTTVTVDFADAEIAGVEEVRPPTEVTPGAAPAVSGPSYGGVQTLPQTGARERNQLLGLLGTAFVALGGGLLLSSRRRNVQR